MADNGSCAWPNCKQTGKDWKDGKCYCKKHYDLAMMKQMLAEDKPAGRTAGTSATIINDV